MYSRDDSDNKDELISSLRHENCMIYSPPSAASLIDNRVLKSYNFSNLSYEFGSTMQAIINSGSDFIWGPSSYLRLEYTVTAGTGGDPNKLPNLGYGSIMNLFKNVRLTHRSGEILEQVISSNVVSQLRRMWGTSLEDRQKLDGMLMGEPVSGLTGQYNSGSQNFLSAGTHVACIPLKYIFGIFDVESQFIPNSLLAGAKMELEMENPAVVFTNWTAFGTGVTAGSVTAFKPTLVLDSAMIFQALQKQLLAEQSNVEDSGLSFTYSTYFTTSTTPQAGSNVSLDIQQSATLCEKVTSVARLAAAPGAQDNFQFFLPYSQYQYRLGSLYFPQQIISVPTTATLVGLSNDANEIYANALTAWGSYPKQFNKSMMKGSGISMYPSPIDGVVSIQAFVAAGADGLSLLKFTPLGPSFSTSAGCYATTLEKQANGMSLTGNATNNSRILNLVLNNVAADQAAVQFQIVACLQYIRCCHLMGDNCVVDR